MDRDKRAPSSNRWQRSAKDGLILASISVITMLIQTWLLQQVLINRVVPNYPRVNGLVSFLGAILWVAKLWLSLYILYNSIKRESNKTATFSYQEGFGYGSLVALFSSFVVASFFMLHHFTLFPSILESQMESALSLHANNPDIISAFETIAPSLPNIFFFFSLTYFTLFGVIASAIMANYTKKDFPLFYGGKKEEE